MANTKEIRNKIKSIQSTQKITRAMEMVAASKMRKAQEGRISAKPYGDRIKEVIDHLLDGSLEYVHPYTVVREKNNNIGYIVVSTNRGLCGGLNTNLFRALLKDMSIYDEKKIGFHFSLIGKKSVSFLNKFNFNIHSSITDMTDKPNIEKIIAVVKIMLDLYNDKKIDVIKLVYNQFVNTMTQKPTVIQVLPIKKNEKNLEKKTFCWDYIYEPSSQELIGSLIDRFVESLVYQGIVENISCEQAARMVAMKSASDNAGEIISDCKLVYNKERQAAITQELSEIVAGAAAV